MSFFVTAMLPACSSPRFQGDRSSDVMHACDVSGPESLVFNPVEGEEELDGTKCKIKKKLRKNHILMGKTVLSYLIDFIILNAIK